MLIKVVCIFLFISLPLAFAGLVPSIPSYRDFMHRVLINRSDLPSDSFNQEALPPVPERRKVLPTKRIGFLPGVLPGILPDNYPAISPDSLPPVPKAEGNRFVKPKLEKPKVPVSGSSCTKTPLYGVCLLKANPNIPSDINGTIYLRQDVMSDCQYDFINIQVNIDSVPTNDGTTKHGFHIHKFGDLSGGCESMGPHFNPFGTKHGAPWNDAGSRHVGDLGNVLQRGRNGMIKTRIVDPLAKLYGEHSIYGRGLVLHAGKDDLGLGGNPGSEATGNAGKRLACCVIGKSPPHSRDKYSLY